MTTTTLKMNLIDNQKRRRKKRKKIPRRLHLKAVNLTGSKKSLLSRKDVLAGAKRMPEVFRKWEMMSKRPSLRRLREQMVLARIYKWIMMSIMNTQRLLVTIKRQNIMMMSMVAPSKRASKSLKSNSAMTFLILLSNLNRHQKWNYLIQQMYKFRKRRIHLKSRKRQQLSLKLQAKLRDLALRAPP